MRLRDTSTNKPKRRRWLLPLKLLVWAVMTVVLFDVAVMMAALRILTPERLTPLTERVANRALNADVSVRRVNLSLRHSLPFMTVDIDTLVIISHDIAQLPATARDTLPVWADTLADISHMHGGIDIFKLLRGKIDLRNLRIYNPQVNLLVVNEHLNNFAIIPASAATPDTVPTRVPDIRINRFALVNPRKVRFADLSQGIDLQALITAAEMIDNADSNPDSDDFMPLYNVNFSSTIASPVFEYVGMSSIPVAFNGILDWRHDRPYDLSLENFDFMVSKLSGQLNIAMNFYDRLTVRDFDFHINPIKVSTLLDMLPDNPDNQLAAYRNITTDATIALDTRLLSPYTVGSETLPHATATIDIPDCRVRWHDLRLDRLALQLLVDVRGHSLDDCRVTLSRFTAKGPGIDMSLHGSVSGSINDPLFDGEMRGSVDFGRLPRAITDSIDGTLTGMVNTSAKVRGRPSMLTRDGFHRLRIDGDFDLRHIYYIAPDTQTVYYAHHGIVSFGANRGRHPLMSARDSLLSGHINVDSLLILNAGLVMPAHSVSLDFGTCHSGDASDTTLVVPMRGRLRFADFSIYSMTDSGGVGFSGTDAHITMQRYKGNTHLPVFTLDATISKINSGGRTTRVIADGCRLTANLARFSDAAVYNADDPAPARRQPRRKMHPHIPYAAAYSSVLTAREHRPKHPHRVRLTYDKDHNLMVHWGTSHLVRTLFLDWNVDGCLTADVARLVSPRFTLPNIARNFNIKFDNDSASLSRIVWQAGHSDFTISGNISNMRAAFTSPGFSSPLKADFNIESNLVDINELTADKSHDYNSRHAHASSGKSVLMPQPVLLPVNIDVCVNLSARRMAYYDFDLNTVSTCLLMHDGAINLHNLTARSQAGSLNLSALYCAPRRNDMHLGFGLRVDDFNIGSFLDLVSPVDSIMPVVRSLKGIVSAQVAATSDLDAQGRIVMPSLKAVVNVTGDSLSMIDPLKLHRLEKWLLFGRGNRNVINHVAVQAVISDNRLTVYPFAFDFDRYKLGVYGSNDIDMNLDYHIAILHSPLPFRFGIDINGNPHDYHIHVGRADFDTQGCTFGYRSVDAMRAALIDRLESTFNRGMRSCAFAPLQVSAAQIDTKP